MARDFNGTTSVITVPAGALLPPPTGDWTVAATLWVRSTGEGGQGFVFDMAQGFAITRVRLDGTVTRAVNAQIVLDTTTAAAASSTQLPLSAWCLLVVTFRLSDRTVRIYTSPLTAAFAEVAYQSQTVGVGVPVTDVQPVRIGNNAGATRTWDGLIARVAYATRLWTPDDMESYRLGDVPLGSLVGYWPLDNPDTTKALDLSGNGNSGTPVGVAYAEDAPIGDWVAPIYVGTRLTSPTQTYTRTASDSSPAAEGVATIFVGVRNPGETVGGSDSPTRLFTGARSASDAAAVSSDGASVLRAGGNIGSLDIGSGLIGDPTKQIVVVSRTASDTAPVSADAVVAMPVVARSGADTATSADAVIRSQVLVRSVADSAPVSDQAAVSGQDSPIGSNNIGSGLIGNPAKPIQTYTRTAGDTAGVTGDGGAPVIFKVRTSFEALSTSDGDSQSVQWIGAAWIGAGAIGVVALGGVNRAVIFGRTGAEALSAPSDAALRPSAVVRNGGEALTTTDAALRGVSLRRLPGDSAPATDTGQRQPVTFFRSGQDLITPADAATRPGSRFNRSPSDNAPSVDAAGWGSKHIRATNDGLGVGDTATRGQSLSRSAGDATPTADAATRLPTLVRVVVAVAGAAESVARIVVVRRAAADLGRITGDAAVRSHTYDRDASDVTASGFIRPPRVILIGGEAALHLGGGVYEKV